MGSGKLLVAALVIVALSQINFAAGKNRIDIKKQPGYISGEIISKATDMTHSSTIVETKNGLLVAWFGGTAEYNSDCQIWCSKNIGKGWSKPPIVIASNKDYNSEIYPCWNPVLFKLSDKKIVLFYKMGESPYTWFGRYKISVDDGASWGASNELPAGVLGPIKNQPILLNDGQLLCPTSFETKNPKIWNVYFNILSNPETDIAKWNWKIVGPLNNSDIINNSNAIEAIQPALLMHSDGSIQALCRTKQKYIGEIWSKDNGKTWSEMRLTNVPNPDSGIDAITLKDGRYVLVYNNATSGRTPLNLAVSKDGRVWRDVLVLENNPEGSYAYPYLIQSADGLLRITYTAKDTDKENSSIKYVVVDPSKF